MPDKKSLSRKPSIAITRSDHAKLSRFVASLPEGAIADELGIELDRARLVGDDDYPETIVRMGSTLTYSTDDGESRVVTLVFPGEADIAAGRVSILTPIGVALLGLSAGQSINWTARDGRTHRLSIDHIEAAGTAPLRAAAS